MVKQIFTLCGNHLEETSRYKLCLEFPSFKGQKYFMSFNRDRLCYYDNFNLVNVENGKEWYLVLWVSHLNMYLQVELKFIEYIQQLDIKYEWKYQKELRAWEQKNSKTIRSNKLSRTVSHNPR